MTEPTPGIPAQTNVDAAADGSNYTPSSAPAFAPATATAAPTATNDNPVNETTTPTASTEFPVHQEPPPSATIAGAATQSADAQASLAVYGPSGASATPQAEPAPTTAERASQLAEKAGDAISDAADKAHEVIGEAAEKAGDAISDAAHNAMTRIRNNATLPAARGHTTIANEVVEKIAGIAAREVPGVYDLGGDVARLFSSIRERLNLGEESKAQGVAVRLEGAAAEITVTIVVEFGFVVSSVTDKVREKVISSVEALLQLDVKSVDVVVDDIHVEEDGPIGNDKERAHGYTSSTEAIVVGQ